MQTIVENFCQLFDNGNVAEANEVFNEIDRELRPYLINTILKTTSKKEFSKQGEDIVQEIICGILKSLKDTNKRWVAKRSINGNKSASFKTWAKGFIRFKTIDSYRKEKRHVEGRKDFDDLEAEGMSPLDIVDCNESIERIYKEIRILPEIPQMAITRRIEGFKGIEIAEEYGLTPVQVNREVKKTIQSLEKKIF